MRARIAVVFLSAAFAGVLSTVPAGATDCSGVLSPCINDDALWPHAGPARFIAVGSAQTVAASHLGFGLVASYLSRPIVLRLASPGASQESKQNAVNDQVNATFLWSYGVTNRLELDIALPLTLGQGGTGLAPVTAGPGLKDTAVRDLRFGFAYAILPRLSVRAGAAAEPSAATGDRFALLARFEVSAPTGDQSQFAGEHSGVFAPSVAADYRLMRFFAGAELGARLRPTNELLGARVGSQLVGALGLGYEIVPHALLSAGLEAWILPTFAEQDTVRSVGGMYVGAPNGSHITPAEWQLSVRSAPTRDGDLSIELGGGSGIPFGGDLPITAPRFRFVLGLRWEP
jgi:OmpA-OmpF porin, OOP family